MKNTEIEARALVLRFMEPIDELHKYPMCFDTAKQCALIAISILLKNSEVLNVRHLNGVKSELLKL